MCVDWSFYEWKVCLVVCFHSVDRIFALLCFDNGTFGRILDLSFLLHVETHLFCSCVIHWSISIPSWHYVECSIRWWVVLVCFLGFCWVWQCNDQMDKGIPFLMIIPIGWKADCDLFCLVSFWKYGLGWIVFWFRTKGGNVPGCATRLSVAPFVGEQPWSSALRCCYPRSKWSMMSSIFSETFSLPHKGFCHCSVIWTYGNWKILQF